MKHIYTKELVESFIENEQNLLDHFQKLEGMGVRSPDYFFEKFIGAVLTDLHPKGKAEERNAFYRSFDQSAELLPILKKYFNWKEEYSIEVLEEEPYVEEFSYKVSCEDKEDFLSYFDSENPKEVDPQAYKEDLGEYAFSDHLNDSVCRGDIEAVYAVVNVSEIKLKEEEVKVDFFSVEAYVEIGRYFENYGLGVNEGAGRCAQVADYAKGLVEEWRAQQAEKEEAVAV